MWRTMLLSMLLLKLKAANSQIISSGPTRADYGSDAHYKCELHNQTGVLQVTWQRRLKDGSVENLASYSKRHGQQVNEPYQEKVMLTEVSLSSASITLKNLTWADEGCYICQFNVYPGGSKKTQTCLAIQGISEVQTKVYPSAGDLTDSTKQVTFSCSATGKPAPAIRWLFSPDVTSLHEPLASMEATDDLTLTSSSNVTVVVYRGWTGHADCVVENGSRGRTMERITFSWNPDQGKREGEPGGSPSPVMVVGIVSGISVAIIAVVIICIVKWTQKRVKDYKIPEVVGVI
ncbi:OX-2 membrane glycoprotein-like isoform X2 [Nerophis lumbriciformis]|uniref:OX-2 membrane glycoprotein-like isoform X2 n=1 Tax=Nerophis lumbriciformis TaxID=546530 RepID=UPI002ADFABF8|nr:OX-2 membrane glycoprotein-like isoform X2 [Nerophis lumbriciformis]